LGWQEPASGGQRSQADGGESVYVYAQTDRRLETPDRAQTGWLEPAGFGRVKARLTGYDWQEAMARGRRRKRGRT
jgi:hypothetical protein